MAVAPSDHCDTSSLLRPEATCWRSSNAHRATLLVDGEEYYGALRAALLQARKLVLIAGWDFDSRTELPPRQGDPACDEIHGAPTQLGELLGYLLRTRPGLQIHVVRWAYHWLYRDDRETDTRQQLERQGVRYHEDNRHPTTGCVHHKVVVIDDALAFCGGIDLTHNRWDTRQHDPQNALRRDHNGKAYMPVHDTQLCVSGPAAADLGVYLRDNWPDAEPPARVQASEELWPTHLRVDFYNIRTGLCRTLPAPPHAAAVREVEAFYLAAIGRTQRSLYLENQYFTCTHIAEAIAARCRAAPELQGLLVGMVRPKTAVELHTMGYGLRRFYSVLARTGAIFRVPLTAAVHDSAGINLHSKLAMFDDRWLTVGSANLNRRSMGFDVECNLVLEAGTAEHRQRMQELRHDLIAEHLGMQPNAVASFIRTHGLARAPEAASGARRLIHLRPDELAPHFGPLLAPLFDRDRGWTPPAATLPDFVWRSGLLPLTTMTLIALSGAALWDDLPTLAALQRSFGLMFDS
jgi:phospholipase D1/2